jgi:hypothetical protein
VAAEKASIRAHEGPLLQLRLALGLDGEPTRSRAIQSASPTMSPNGKSITFFI